MRPCLCLAFQSVTSSGGTETFCPAAYIVPYFRYTAPDRCGRSVYRASIVELAITRGRAISCSDLLGPKQGGDPRERTDDPTQRKTPTSRSQAAGRRKKFPQTIHNSSPSLPSTPTASAATILECVLENDRYEVAPPLLLVFCIVPPATAIYGPKIKPYPDTKTFFRDRNPNKCAASP